MRVAVFFAASALVYAAAEPAGPAIYQQHCAVCHDAGGANRIPARSALAQLPPDAIVTALTSGAMKQQGSALTAQQRIDVATWLSASVSPAKPAAQANLCSSSTPSAATPSSWTNWGNGLLNQRYQPDSGLTPASVARLKLKWAYGIPGVKTMRSQPVVYRGRIYLGGDNGSVVSLDAATGCQYWSAQMRNVRSGLSIGRAGDADALFFGEFSGVAHALDLATGKELWQTKVADHPAAMITATPVYADGHVYVALSSYEEVAVLRPGYPCCTFRGSVSSINAATGELEWRSYTIEQKAEPNGDQVKVLGPSGAPIWSAPTVDSPHGVLYVATGDNYSDPASTTSDSVIAIDLKSGKQVWSKQFTTNDVFNLACGKPGVGACKNGNGPDFDFGSSPMLVDLGSGKRCLLMAQKSGMVYAVDPDAKGASLWEARAGKGSTLGGVQWGPASDGALYYVAVSDIAFLNTSTPMKLVADPKAGGGLSAYVIKSGKLAWKAEPPICADRPMCSPAQSAAVTAIRGAVFSGSLDGHVRAYSSKDGAVLWDFDTERSFETVNHIPAEGGSLDVSGPVIAGGMVFVSSGYPQYGGKGGNVLLAFAPDAQ